MTNLVISFSQQMNNQCLQGDKEQDHCQVIAKELYTILKGYPEFNLFLMPKFYSDGLKKTVELSNGFINASGGQGYHIEIHTDAGGYARGCSGLYVSEGGFCFVKPIIESLSLLTPWKDVGMRMRKDLFVLNNTIAKACLVEVSFHDNPEEAKWIHDNIKKIAESIASGICKNFNVDTKINNIKKALEVLTSKGVMNSPEYWSKRSTSGVHEIDGECLEQLLINMANKVR